MYKHLFSFFFVALSILCPSCKNQQQMAYMDARNKNVCKKLLSKVLVYGVFVETKTSRVWTEKEIRAASDSARVAISWLQEKAVDNDISLDLSFESIRVPEKANIADLPVSNKKGTDNAGTEKFLKWADGSVKKFAPTLPNKDFNDSMPHIKAPKDLERFIAKLRDERASESVAVIFFLNMNEKEAYSYNVNSNSNTDIEFSVTGYNRSGVIAFEILRLFGANSLAKKSSDISSKEEKLIKLTGEDIMVKPFTDIDEMQISDYTKYLVGWKKDLDKKIQELLQN